MDDKYEFSWDPINTIPPPMSNNPVYLSGTVTPGGNYIPGDIVWPDSDGVIRVPPKITYDGEYIPGQTIFPNN